MVRVLSVHNFPKQEVMAVDEIVSATVASPHILLLAQKNHSIYIKNVCDGTSFAIPTVDQATSIHYSSKGNYIACVESRGDVKFVRAYLNWEAAGGSAPLRARIAGRVTPLSQQGQGVEMLEVPTPGMPECIAVCSNSGNLVVGCGTRVSVFYFKVQMHEKSRADFVDFIQSKWTVEFGFSPSTLSLCEDVIAAYNNRYLQIVKVGHPKIKEEKPADCESTDYDDLVAAGVITTCEFPSVAAEPQLRQSPFLSCPDLAVSLFFENSKAEAEANLCVTELLSLLLTPCVVGGASRREVADLFTCLQLKPYYKKHSDVLSGEVPPLGSNMYHKLFAVACFFGTQQEGYLYHFDPANELKKSPVSVYPFTAPLVSAAMEDSLLHAVTDAGLETYTLKAPIPSDVATDHEEDPICLLGLRPFLHVRELLLEGTNLFLIASEDCEPSTIYQLSLADPTCIWTDFFSAACENQWDAPATYSQLIREAQHILKVRWECVDQRDPTAAIIEKTYRHACAVLADYYLLYDDVESASNLYRVSQMKINDVTKRILKLTKNIPEVYRNKFSCLTVKKNLVQHLENCVKIEDEKYRKHGGNKEDFYTPEIGSLVATILDIAEHEAPSELSRLILSSPLIQTFGSDKSHSALSNLDNRTAADTLALSQVSFLRGQQDRGISLLRELAVDSLEPLLVSYGEILLMDDSLSDLGLTLLTEFLPLFMRVLSKLVESRKIKLSVLQKILMAQLQPGGTRGKNSAEALQAILEKELSRFRDERKLYYLEAQELCGTLIWLYLTQLNQRWETVCSEEPLFRDLRPAYLDHLPPFGHDLSQILSPQPNGNAVPDNGEPKNVLLRLQCLLASEPAKNSLYRVRVFLAKTPKVFGSLSIQVQCAAPQEALQLLLNFTPQAFLAYLKEKKIEESEWRNVLNQVSNKITATTDSKRKFYYQQIEQGLLEHIAQTLTLEDAAELLPVDLPGRSLCLRVAHDNEQAAHIRTLIMLTGSQLS